MPQKKLVRSKEWADKISASKKGHKHSDETKRKIGERTKLRAESTKSKRSESMKGKNIGELNSSKRPEVRLKISQGKLGKPNIKIKGEKHYKWKGGCSSINEKIRTSSTYKLWRRAVMERDGFTCIWCGDNKGGNLEVDHIKPFAYFPELRFAIDNGRTLCKSCHKTTDSYGGKSYKYAKEP